MDARDVAANKGRWYETLDERNMEATVWLPVPPEIRDCKGKCGDVDLWHRENPTTRYRPFPCMICYESEELVAVRIKFEVCPLCHGKGVHVNPSIDSHGLTYEDFAEDPDFAEDYRNHLYDVPCYECGGRRVIPVCEDDEYRQMVEAKISMLAAWARVETHSLDCGY